MLYDILGPRGTHAGISDVVSGNNSVIDPKTGNVLVQGFTAGSRIRRRERLGHRRRE